jgi:hypothetical protein
MSAAAIRCAAADYQDGLRRRTQWCCCNWRVGELLANKCRRRRLQHASAQWHRMLGRAGLAGAQAEARMVERAANRVADNHAARESTL